MAHRLNPEEFADKYLKMPLYIFPPGDGIDNTAFAPSGWQTVRVANYRLDTNTQEARLWNDVDANMGKEARICVRTIDGSLVDETLSKKDLKFHFHQPFVGKGSPEQVQIAIQLVYRFHKVKTSLAAFLKANFIGLDCNGFVGNYYQRIIQGTPWKTQNNNLDPGPTTTIDGFMDLAKTKGQIQKLESMNAAEMYVFAEVDPTSGQIIDPSKDNPKNYGHVMLTVPGTFTMIGKTQASMKVVEATADGARELRSLIYTIASSKSSPQGTIFTVWRGSQSDQMSVRIAKFGA